MRGRHLKEAVAPLGSPEEAGDAPVIAMVVRNAVTHDTRVLKEAGTLAEAGYRVVIVGLRTTNSEPESTVGSVRIIRVTVDAPYLTAIRAIIETPRRIDRLWKRAVRRSVLARRRYGSRARRQWDLLADASNGSLARSLWGALRAPRTAIVAGLLLVPAVVARLRGYRAAPPVPEIPMPQTRVSRYLQAAYRLSRRVLGPFDVAARAFAFQVAAGGAMAALRPAVYHCHDFNTIWSSRVAARIHPAPVIYDSHEIYAHQNLPRFTRRRRAFVTLVEWLVVRRAAAVITVNDSISEWLARRYRIARPVVVRNIPAAWSPDPDHEIPAALAQPGTKLLYLGGVMQGRGLETVIAALRHLPGVSLVIMGPGRPQFAEAMARLAGEAGVGDRVHVLPPVPPQAVVAAASHATVGIALVGNVCLSYYLSLPNKLFEYMHAGLPVVGSDFPEIRAIVEGSGIGRVCDPSDVDAIAQAVRDVIRDPDEYERMRANALASATRFTWEAEAARLLELYGAVVPLRHPARPVRPRR